MYSRVLRFNGQRLLILDNRVVQMPGTGQGVAQVVPRLDHVGRQSQCAAVLDYCLVELPAIGQRDAETVKRDHVPLGAGHGAAPHRHAVAPHRRLPPGAGGQRGERGRGQGSSGRAAVRRPAGDFRGAPDCRHEKPDLRQVNKAVGHDLQPGLNQADRRRERAHEPEPADGGVAMPATSGRQRRQRNCRQEDDRAGDRRRAMDGHVGIDRCQPGRPDGLAEIGGVEHRRPGKASGERRLIEGNQRAAGTLCEERHRGRRRHQRQEREFFN